MTWPLPAPSTARLRAGPPVAPADFEVIRRRMLLEGCKWDPQVGDTPTIAAHALLLPRSSFTELARMASELARETLAAEEELAARPELHVTLGVPAPLRRCWSTPPSLAPREERLMRFDVHPTRDGWRVSEVNSDVPGGFAEASLLAALFRPFHPGTSAPPDPARAWVERMGPVRAALVGAPGFMEDQQVLAFLARALERLGGEPVIARVEDVSFGDGAIRVRQGDDCKEVGAVVRFLQAEWLLAWPRPRGWWHYFQRGRTPIFNAGTALLTESKRFPLTWPALRTPTPRWRSVSPESRPAGARPEPGWVLKGAFSNNGDAVLAEDLVEPARWQAALRDASRHPERWIWQRRFEPLPLETPSGPRFLCLGVYTLGEETVGLYGRLSTGSTVGFQATDVAVLIEEGL